VDVFCLRLQHSRMTNGWQGIVSTCHTLVWNGTSILVAVFSLTAHRYRGDGGTDWREILHNGTYRSETDLLPFWGRYFVAFKLEVLSLILAIWPRLSRQKLSYRKQIEHQLRTQYVEGIYRPKYYTVTLKSRLRVTQGHWKWNHWTDHTWLTISRVIWR